MYASDFVDELIKNDINFFTGIPDSKLKSFYDYLYKKFGIGRNHIVAENEGGSVGLAAGYYLATGKIPCIYMQNSGIGNAINPICSLTNKEIYSIPIIYVIGLRGEIGLKDEPQHIFQGKITLKLLELLDIDYTIIDENTTMDVINNSIINFKKSISNDRSLAFVVKENGLISNEKIEYKNDYKLSRERAIEIIINSLSDRAFISTTGKISRELFELREKNKQTHKQDFLTVGSMGHSSMIALGVALNTNKNVCVLDGDGALLMHMGSLSIIGSMKPNNLLHILLNNESHESVGGMPTVARNVDFIKIALACGYKKAYVIENEEELIKVLNSISGTTFIEIKTSLLSRKNLGRPTSTPIENKIKFMKYLGE